MKISSCFHFSLYPWMMWSAYNCSELCLKPYFLTFFTVLCAYYQFQISWINLSGEGDATLSFRSKMLQGGPTDSEIYADFFPSLLIILIYDHKYWWICHVIRVCVSIYFMYDTMNVLVGLYLSYCTPQRMVSNSENTFGSIVRVIDKVAVLMCIML